MMSAARARELAKLQRAVDKEVNKEQYEKEWNGYLAAAATAVAKAVQIGEDSAVVRGISDRCCADFESFLTEQGYRASRGWGPDGFCYAIRWDENI